jgi:hypothetical protein
MLLNLKTTTQHDKEPASIVEQIDIVSIVSQQIAASLVGEEDLVRLVLVPCSSRVR